MFVVSCLGRARTVSSAVCAYFFGVAMIQAVYDKFAAEFGGDWSLFGDCLAAFGVAFGLTWVMRWYWSEFRGRR